MFYSSKEEPPMEKTPKNFSIVANFGNGEKLYKDIERAYRYNEDASFHVLTPGSFLHIEEKLRELGVSPSKITFYGKHNSKYPSKTINCDIEAAIDLIVNATTHDIGDGKRLWFQCAEKRKNLPKYIPMRIKIN